MAIDDLPRVVDPLVDIRYGAGSFRALPRLLGLKV
jgi:hypothetical protein